jgi:hypothetical protein
VIVLAAMVAPASAEPRVAVIGDDAAGVRSAVRDDLDAHVELILVDGKASDATALARNHDLDAVVVVDVEGKKRATVTLVNGADGKRLARYRTKAARGKLAREAGKKAWRELRAGLEAASAPGKVPPPTVAAAPPPKPEKRAKKEVVKEEPAPRASSDEVTVAAVDRPRRRALPWLSLSVEGRTFQRSLRYNDDLDGTLHGYDLAAPAAGIVAVFQPLRSGVGRYLALRGEAELAVGIDGSEDSDGTLYPTSASDWSAGLRVLLPIPAGQWSIDAAYGMHRFTIEDDEMLAELVPDVDYRYVRGALALRAPLGRRLALDASAGYRQLLGTGDLESDPWFPRLKGAGIDAELGARVRIAGPVEFLARAGLRRYFFAMRPEPGDSMIAGGAVDQYLSISAGLAIALR